MKIKRSKRNEPTNLGDYISLFGILIMMSGLEALVLIFINDIVNRL